MNVERMLPTRNTRIKKITEGKLTRLFEQRAPNVNLRLLPTSNVEKITKGVQRKLTN